MAVPDPIDLGVWTRGDTVKLDAALFDSDGTPLDLTGATVWATFKQSLTDDDAIPPGFQRSTTGAGIAIVGLPEDGRVLITIDPTNTSGLTTTTIFTFDIQVRQPSGDIYSPARGSITFTEDVTRATS